jgi:hypothetical protein
MVSFQALGTLVRLSHHSRLACSALVRGKGPVTSMAQTAHRSEAAVGFLAGGFGSTPSSQVLLSVTRELSSSPCRTDRSALWPVRLCSSLRADEHARVVVAQADGPEGGLLGSQHPTPAGRCHNYTDMSSSLAAGEIYPSTPRSLFVHSTYKLDRTSSKRERYHQPCLENWWGIFLWPLR